MGAGAGDEALTSRKPAALEVSAGAEPGAGVAVKAECGQGSQRLEPGPEEFTGGVCWVEITSGRQPRSGSRRCRSRCARACGVREEQRPCAPQAWPGSPNS